jgi:hypothetical protein
MTSCHSQWRMASHAMTLIAGPSATRQCCKHSHWHGVDFTHLAQGGHARLKQHFDADSAIMTVWVTQVYPWRSHRRLNFASFHQVPSSLLVLAG